MPLLPDRQAVSTASFFRYLVSVLACALCIGSCIAQVAAPDRAPAEISDRRPVNGALLALYNAYLDHERGPDAGKPFQPLQTGLLLAGQSVVVDLVADGNARDLADDAVSIGATHIAVAGQIVSCRLPLASIGKLEHLASLKFANPVVATTDR